LKTWQNRECFDKGLFEKADLIRESRTIGRAKAGKAKTFSGAGPNR